MFPGGVDTLFTSQKQAFDTICSSLEDNCKQQIIEIIGLPGTGKSTVAELIVQRFSNHRILVVDSYRFNNRLVSGTSKDIIITLTNPRKLDSYRDHKNTISINPLCDKEIDILLASSLLNDDEKNSIKNYSLGIPRLIKAMENICLYYEGAIEKLTLIKQIAVDYLIQSNGSNVKMNDFGHLIKDRAIHEDLLYTCNQLDNFYAYSLSEIMDRLSVRENIFPKNIKIIERYKEIINSGDGYHTIQIYVPNILKNIVEKTGLSVSGEIGSSGRETPFNKYGLGLHTYEYYSSEFGAGGHVKTEILDSQEIKDATMQYLQEYFGQLHQEISEGEYSDFYLKIYDHHKSIVPLLKLGYLTETLLQHYDVPYFFLSDRADGKYMDNAFESTEYYDAHTQEFMKLERKDKIKNVKYI